MAKTMMMIDGNEAAAYIAHKTNEVCAIYPITPSSPMGELADEWSARGQANIWGTIPHVIEMQSEGGAAGAVHGSLQTGALTTTFTASQGLLLMIPNMYKIAGELTSTVFHIAARTVATHALSIFGDHSDVMAARQCGWAMLAAGSVQEVMDFALIAQASTLKARVPFVHFFDGFRTSHEVQKIERVEEEVIRAMIDDDLVRAHRARGLTPDHPIIRGTAQNPDVFFQAREAANPYYEAVPGIVQAAMDKFGEMTGRQYKLFEYIGAPDAEVVLVSMGSSTQTIEDTVEYLTAQGVKVGAIKARLYRPFFGEAFINALPATCKTVVALDRTKEPGATGEPLYLDMVTALMEHYAERPEPFARIPRIIGGRYGLSSKEFTPAMVKAVIENAQSAKPKNHFTVGIKDDITHTSLEFDPAFSIESDKVFRGKFYGLGSDGTVGANKNSIKIIGTETDDYAQGYFVYDSKKSGSMTVSHLRFGPEPIRACYLVNAPNFVACHQATFLNQYDMLSDAVEGSTFLLNTTTSADKAWDMLPRKVQDTILAKKIKYYVVDAYEVAAKHGMGRRINTVMQTCFFALCGVLKKDAAIEAIKKSIKKTYGKKGDAIVAQNFAVVDDALSGLHEVKVPDKAAGDVEMRPAVSKKAPIFVQEVLAPMMSQCGDTIPTSALPADGTFPTATTQWEKRNIALEVPIWDPDVCIQCGKCAMVCPHACIRIKAYDPKHLDGAPDSFLSMDTKGGNFYPGNKYTIQVAPEDCTGCTLCVEVCPAKNKSQPRLKAINMEPHDQVVERERVNYDFFLSLPEVDRTTVRMDQVKTSQLLRPLFEYSGACAGCGETPYLKLLTQLFGDRTAIANATGCSSIYGGNLPTTPYAQDGNGRGPAWSNSLFEDNAEFGLGYRLAYDKRREYAQELVKALAPKIGDDLATAILEADQSEEIGIIQQRERVAALIEKLKGVDDPKARELETEAEMLVKKSVWIVGGDGWAFDIGYGGLDHVLASGRDVNVLVLNTEVYSNTGGQSSKATPRAAVAKFAYGGKQVPRKDLGMIAMSYGGIYVASIAMGANDLQTVKAFLEAESYPGPSLIIAYSHCIAHGFDLKYGIQQQKAAVDSGYLPLYRFDPRKAEAGENPLHMDSRAPKIKFEDYAYNETRYKMLTKSNPAEAKRLMELAQHDIEVRRAMYEQLAADGPAKGGATPTGQGN